MIINTQELIKKYPMLESVLNEENQKLYLAHAILQYTPEMWHADAYDLFCEGLWERSHSELEIYIKDWELIDRYYEHGKLDIELCNLSIHRYMDCCWFTAAYIDEFEKFSDEERDQIDSQCPFDIWWSTHPDNKLTSSKELGL